MPQLELNMLKQLIAGTAQTKISAKELIYDVITKQIIPNLAKDECPPHFILIYAIRDILYPKIILERIPDLLNFLAQLDHIRREAVRQAQEALALHKSYIKDPSLDKELVNVLTPPEVKALAFAKPTTAAAHRDLYRSIALTFCYFHIYSIWTSDISFKIPVLMRSYFPFQSDTIAPAHILFLHDLSPAEIQEAKEIEQTCKEFISEANAWEADRTNLWKERGYPPDSIYSNEEPFSYIRDFQERFPSLTPEEKELAETVEEYLRRVETIMTSLESIFGSQQTLAEND